MQTLILIRNTQERLIARGFFPDPETTHFPVSLEELSELLQNHINELSLIVLDERSGELIPTLENIAVMRANRPLVLLVLIEQRAPTVEAWRAESEKLETYANLGVELLLHRPYGTKELEEKIAEACTWAKALPPWAQLVRAGRVMMKTQEAGRILKGLASLYAKRPHDTTIGLVYARALLASQPSRYEEACKVLSTLEQNTSRNFRILKMLAETHDSVGNFVPAMNAYLKICTSTEFNKLNAENFKWYMNTRLAENVKDPKVWLSIFSSLTQHEAEKWAELCLICLEQMSKHLQTLEDFSEFIAHIPELPNRKPLGPALKALLKKLDSHPWPADQKAAKEALALQFIERILEVDPGAPDLLYRLVQIHLRGGNAHLIEPYLRRARVAGGFSFEYHVSMTMLALLQKDEPGAEKALQQAESDAPENLSMEEKKRRRALLTALKNEIGQLRSVLQAQKR